METLGRKFAMNTACAVFALGTVCCATSNSMYTLIASRALAGVSPSPPYAVTARAKGQLGGGGMLTVSSVIVTDLVPLRDRGWYQGDFLALRLTSYLGHETKG